MLKVFNTLTRRKDEFHPLEEGRVGMYSCGPTVYDVPHLGNFRSFVMSDNIRRYLEYVGYDVKQVMNITDIDDKTIRGSGEEGISLSGFTRRYEKAFFDGLRALSVLPAHEYPRATENVDLIVLDVVMPKKNGFQVCRDLKKDPEYKDIPIILLTSKSQESDKFWGSKQGADEYLTKPCSPKDLMDAVQKFLK